MMASAVASAARRPKNVRQPAVDELDAGARDEEARADEGNGRARVERRGNCRQARRDGRLVQEGDELDDCQRREDGEQASSRQCVRLVPQRQRCRLVHGCQALDFLLACWASSLSKPACRLHVQALGFSATTKLLTELPSHLQMAKGDMAGRSIGSRSVPCAHAPISPCLGISEAED